MLLPVELLHNIKLWKSRLKKNMGRTDSNMEGPTQSKLRTDSKHRKTDSKQKMGRTDSIQKRPDFNKMGRTDSKQ